MEELDLCVLDCWDFGPQNRYLGTAIDQMLKAIGMRGPYTHYWVAPEERTACAQRFLYLFRLIKPNVVWPRLDGLTPAIQLEGESLFGHGASVILATPLAHGLLTGAASGNARCSRQRQKSLLPQPSTRSLPVYRSCELTSGTHPANAYLSPCVRDFGESADATPTPAGGPQ
ncbi:hypothetical protein ACFZCY_41450 [Streptomyces sp. NPDC007983]|uniref:hypothetical protein n=1 Tax=Streptomyces sp. NPDC007983 TaxID=3364800 RepID=UPI0036E1AB5F